ncbi:hypothetical protein [Anaerotignum sp. MB30-C6]|uniref:hypothetical protein n=1 Tax=Anaerotignum sp. MB30-C6 TaxID=3070814 RepID=UPI0027DB7266|nr:hypothetical protein [Anaerotignum sp. MB30-C6]WMI82026.1 hypothetical protein RBQ60_04655 [Anaerotignum sp. MB30-C6]
MEKPARQENKKMEVQFSKEAILRSQKYRNYRDLLSVVLEKSKAYTYTEIDSVIEKFQKGKVR